ncbi:MAG TPA: carbamoyltransferase HypF [Archaeoglobaceae archaeon]|nr:carbamoyltransferase HypF [Archaeoglobaceae archaeon]
MYLITVKGIVQGVGFRPFVYRLAKSMDLKGYVKNTGDGTVEILIDRDVDRFVDRLKSEKPPISFIDSLRVEETDGKAEDFTIEKSGGRSRELSLPPPDVAVCDKCIEELFNPSDRRYLYTFISCTDCGMRFTVAEKLPYDRENTTFEKFPLCIECSREYWDVEDRRYYAQSIACPTCGPHYELVYGKRIKKGLDGIIRTAELLDSGKIIAIRGMGGFHIASLTDDEIVWKLRKILKRPQQPFAVMARDIETVKKIGYINEEEEEIMQHYIRPITVIRKKSGFDAVAPHLDTLGVMLPYAPIHYILFEFLDADFLVMTSANMLGEPMFLEDPELPVDGILRHNLKIYNRTDDSVIKFINGHRMIIRRSRGFTPKTISVNSRLNAIALGAELYNSISLLKDGKAVVSQYIGNTANFKTYNEFFKRAVNFFINFMNMDRLDAVICDAHPLYNTSAFAERFAEEKGTKLIRVQHHFAHAMSVMAEKNLDKAIGIAVDGVGYGFDGSVWGCEVLKLDFDKKEFSREGRLETIKLPGGDLAVNYPLRTLFSIVYNEKGDYEMLEPYRRYLRKGETFEIIAKQIDSGVALANASSAGRYLDAISAMLEVCFERTYEGEPAMKLEAIVEKAESYYNPEFKLSTEENIYPAPYTQEYSRKSEIDVLRTNHVICNALERYQAEKSEKGKIAFQLIDYLARGMAEMAAKAAKSFTNYVVMSGGVAYNSYFTPLVENYLNDYGLKLYLNTEVASGDNGISLGQIYITKYLDH